MALLRYILMVKEAESFEVTTGAGNEPAKALYRKWGFLKLNSMNLKKGLFFQGLRCKHRERLKSSPIKKNGRANFSRKKQLEALFRNEVLHIHHIGSTSIPGMSAKPIIDILIEVKDLGSAAGFEKGMKMLGYEPKGKTEFREEDSIKRETEAYTPCPSV